VRRNKRIVAAAIVVGALVFAGAAAFTNSISFTPVQNTTVAYGALNVSNATVESITYGLSADGTTINSVTLVTVGDTSGSTASVGFTVAGTPGATRTCSLVDYNITNVGDTTYSCTGYTQSVTAITATDVVLD
jgi:hypothetical protein